jgi:hypothetical protein
MRAQGKTEAFRAKFIRRFDVHNKHTGRMNCRLFLSRQRRSMLHPNDTLKLVFHHTERGSREYLLRATVMRLKADGVGLMFLEGDGNAAAALLSDNRLV